MHWDRPQLLLLLILLPLCCKWIRLARRPWLTVLRVVSIERFGKNVSPCGSVRCGYWNVGYWGMYLLVVLVSSGLHQR